MFTDIGHNSYYTDYFDTKNDEPVQDYVEGFFRFSIFLFVESSS